MSGVAGTVRVRRVASRTDLEACWRLRHDVFVDEQGVPPEVEVDDHDSAQSTSHVLAVGADATPLGTGRLLRDAPGQVHLGRLAVRRSARGHGVGALLVAELCAIALAEHRAGEPPSVRVALSAQESATGFYERLGFAVVAGQRYLDAGIWHRAMARTLPTDDTPRHVG